MQQRFEDPEILKPGKKGWNEESVHDETKPRQATAKSLELEW